MSTINSVYWEIEPHTEVKHTILKEYLNAWLPILTNHQIRTRNNDIIYIDGFAGPGKYQDGTKGSPIIAIDCLLGHYQNLIRTGVNFHYFFIEQHKERFDALTQTISEFYPSLPENLKYFTINDEFSNQIEGIINRMKMGQSELPPTFAFIDPFGYNGLPLMKIKKILTNPKSEVLINFSYKSINRFIETYDSRQEILDGLFGCDDWRDFREIEDPEERTRKITGLYRSQLMRIARYILSFEMKDRTNNISYYLFFGSNHREGFKYMKRAMWKADRRGTYRFSDTQDCNQAYILDYSSDDQHIEEQAKTIYEKYKHLEVSIETIEKFIDEESLYPGLKKASLKFLESDGKINNVFTASAKTRRTGTFPPGSNISFQ
jgi:three-Cys-motif partner protein